MQATDQKPWYMQFWPWFIMAIPACGVIAGIATVFIANSHAPLISQTNIERFGRVSEPAPAVHSTQTDESRPVQ